MSSGTLSRVESPLAQPGGTGQATRRAEAREQARDLFAVYAGDPHGPAGRRARERLIEMHLPLVRYFARRYAGRREPLDDLVQVGCVGLVKAVDRFDLRRGVDFSTFAAPTILGELRRYFRDATWAVHVVRDLQELSMAVSRAVTELTGQLGRAPTVREIADRVGHSEEQVLEALDCAAAYRADSLEAPAREGVTLGDTLGAEDPRLLDVELHESLTPALSALPMRERRILQMRFFGGMTQSQIGAELGISQMHVSRLLARTLAQLRERLQT